MKGRRKMYCAKPTGRKEYHTYYSKVEYEYRGERYGVIYPHGINFCWTHPKVQHEEEQRKIDEAILKKNADKLNQPQCKEDVWDLIEKYFIESIDWYE